VHPLAYAIKAFDLASHGKLVAVKLPDSQANISAYGVLRNDRTLYVTLINKDHGTTTHAAEVTLELPRGYDHAETMSLIAPGNDIGATSDIKLGGSSISGDGAWNGTWSRAKIAARQATLTLPPASAVIVKLTAGR
jgi:hypothetical protein